MRAFIILLLSGISCFSQNISKQDTTSVKNKKINVIAIPMVNYSNSFGASFGTFASGFYITNINDTISPLSSSGLIATYSTNKTWFLGQVNKLYLNEDKLRIKSAIDSMSALNFNNILPAVGAGFRFLAIPKSNISIGMDVAVGKKDWGLYFRISEAFTR